MTPTRVVERVLVRWIPVDGCWISTYSAGSHGYAQVGWTERGRTTMRLAHRVMWSAFHGPIPDGLTVDHTCHVRKCINPRHLRLLSNSENASDNGMKALRTRTSTGRRCHQGHELVRSASGVTGCRECVAAWKRARRQNMKESA